MESLKNTLHAGQPETPTSNEDLKALLMASAERERILLKKVEILSRQVEGLCTSVIYTAIKPKDMLVKIGYTDDWETRRKTHERNRCQILAFQPDTKKTEDRFKAVLRSQGIDPIGGKGFQEVYRLRDQFLTCARNFQWPLGDYTQPLPYRKTSPYSKPGHESGQGHLFGNAA